MGQYGSSLSGAEGLGFAQSSWQDSQWIYHGISEQVKASQEVTQLEISLQGELGNTVKGLCRLRNLDLVYRGQSHLLGIR